MPRAPVADRLRHMLDAIARIETLTVGKTLEDYAADWFNAMRSSATSSGCRRPHATSLRS